MEINEELIKEWKAWYLKEGHTWKSTKDYHDYILLFFKQYYEGTINQKVIDQFREKHYNSVSSGALKKFFHFLVFRKGYPRELLTLYFGKNKSTKKAPSSIQPIEMMEVIKGMTNPPYPIMMRLLTIFTYELALRISEGLKVTWADFNWMTWLQNPEEFGTVMIKNTKRGKFRVIPVSSEIMKLLYDTHKQRTPSGVPTGGLVFNFGIADFDNKEQTLEQNQFEYLSYAYHKYKAMLEKVSQETIGKKIRPHQLRHGKAQSLLDSGVSLEGLKLLLGHASISTTELYAQASPEKLKKELKAYDTIKTLQIEQPKVNTKPVSNVSQELIDKLTKKEVT